MTDDGKGMCFVIMKDEYGQIVHADCPYDFKDKRQWCSAWSFEEEDFDHIDRHLCEEWREVMLRKKEGGYDRA